MDKIIDKEQREINRLLNQFVEEWNRKDAQSMALLFTEEAEFTDIMGQVAQGRERVAAMHLIVFEHVMKKAQLSQETLYLRKINENQVMATCKWITKGHTDPEGNALPDRSGLMVMILSPEIDDWKISLVQNFDFSKMYNQIEEFEMKVF